MIFRENNWKKIPFKVNHNSLLPNPSHTSHGNPHVGKIDCHLRRPTPTRRQGLVVPVILFKYCLSICAYISFFHSVCGQFFPCTVGHRYSWHSPYLVPQLVSSCSYRNGSGKQLLYPWQSVATGERRTSLIGDVAYHEFLCPAVRYYYDH